MSGHNKNQIMTETYTNPKTVAQQENEFLQQQADEAKAAIGNAIAQAKTSLAEGMDPKAWTRKYPLIAVGSALAAGFVAAAITVTSKEPRQEPASPPPPPPPPPRQSFWWSLIKEAVEMVRPVLTAALVAAVKAPPSSREPADPPGPPSTHPPGSFCRCDSRFFLPRFRRPGPIGRQAAYNSPQLPAAGCRGLSRNNISVGWSTVRG